MTGPKLQKDLAEILLKFRERPIAIGADIEAMFSRIRLTKDDARYHRFLMPDKQTGKIEVYQMNRLTFGDGASPFVAMSTLHRTADDYGVFILRRSFLQSCDAYVFPLRVLTDS